LEENPSKISSGCPGETHISNDISQLQAYYTITAIRIPIAKYRSLAYILQALVQSE